MFRSYDYLQAEIYTSEINMTPKFKIIQPGVVIIVLFLFTVI
jgi:hypothetical protein